MGIYDNSMSAISTYGGTSGPAYERVSSIPSWLPRIGTGELEQQYRDTGRMFDPTSYNVASRSQQSRVLTTALNAGNNAATDYANRARQAGGSGMGAGLVKAQAAVGARATAGAMELDRAKYEADQRERAASHASQIASTLGELRQSYLQSIVGYATAEDQISLGHRQAANEERRTDLAANESNRRNNYGQYFVDNMGRVSNMAGTPLSMNPFFNPTTGYLAHGGG